MKDQSHPFPLRRRTMGRSRSSRPSASQRDYWKHHLRPGDPHSRSFAECLPQPLSSGCRLGGLQQRGLPRELKVD